MQALVIAGLAAMTLTGQAHADWSPATPEVAAAVHNPRIAGALAAVEALDRSTISGDHAAFGALLADDLAVNNPQNGMSVRGATSRRSAAGQIDYVRYHRSTEYAGLRDGMVLLMGEETVVPKGGTAEVHRRFTDLWKQAAGRWLLTAREATIISL